MLLSRSEQQGVGHLGKIYLHKKNLSLFSKYTIGIYQAQLIAVVHQDDGFGTGAPLEFAASRAMIFPAPGYGIGPKSGNRFSEKSDATTGSSNNKSIGGRHGCS
jgi:hypothetical protein